MDNQIRQPMKWRELTIKSKIIFSLGIASFAVSVLLCFLSLILPPMGVIPTSVISAMALFIAFTCGIYGINLHYTNELTNFETQIKENVDKYLNEKV